MYMGEKFYVCMYFGCDKRFLCFDELIRYVRIYLLIVNENGFKGKYKYYDDEVSKFYI